jgi:hypothetical protein
MMMMMMNNLYAKTLVYGAVGYAIGMGLSIVFSYNWQPKGTLYGSRWHQWMGHNYHAGGKGFYVHALVPGATPKTHVNCFGGICETCGFVKRYMYVAEDGEIPNYDLDFGPSIKWTID